jgi:molecular chaperone DnaK
LVKENEEHVDASLKDEVEQKISDLKAALEGEDNATIESALQQLQETLQKIGQEVYSKTGEAAGAPPEEETPSQDDPENTVEGEFREV